MIEDEINQKFETFWQEYSSVETSEEREFIAKKHNFELRQARRQTFFGKRNIYNENNHHWDFINLDKVNNDKPMLICLSGNGTTTTKDANGFCKFAEDCLKLMFENRIQDSTNPEDYLDIVSCTYGGYSWDKDDYFRYQSDEIEEKYSTDREYMKAFPRSAQSVCCQTSLCEGVLTEEDAKEFVDNIMIPRCIRDGKRQSVYECCRRMSQVVFFTFCYGNQALNKIMDTFEKELLSLGYEKDEIETIEDSMSNISFARNQYTPNIPTTYFYSVDDGVMQTNQFRLREIMEKENMQMDIMYRSKGDKPVISFKDEERYYNHTSLEVQYLGKDESDSEYPIAQSYDHYVSTLYRDEDWHIINKTNKTYDCASQQMAWALCRAVQNGLQNSKSDNYIPRMSMEELKNDLSKIQNNVLSSEYEDTPYAKTKRVGLYKNKLEDTPYAKTKRLALYKNELIR